MRRVTELLDPWGDNDTAVPDELAPPEPDQHPRFTPEPFNPWEIDTPAEPGGPAPPDDQAD
jgi:hypothetical protein